MAEPTDKVIKTDEEWRQILTPEQFDVMRRHGTEPPFKNAYWDCKSTGIYRCACCGHELFDSDHKYDSGTGWPSFWLPIEEAHVENESDLSHEMDRTEVHCARCGAHLGHLFPDGPRPSGLRYCINSISIELSERPADE